MMLQFYTNVIKYGSNILYRGIHDGETIQKRIKYRPVLYEKTEQETRYHDIYGTPVKSKIFESMSEAWEYTKTMRDIDNYQVYGYDNYVTQFIQEGFPDNIEWDMDQIAVVNFDIEVSSNQYQADPYNTIVLSNGNEEIDVPIMDLHKYRGSHKIRGYNQDEWIPVEDSVYMELGGFPEPEDAFYPVTAISLRNSKSKTYHTWGMKPLDIEDPTLVPSGYRFKYHQFKTEKELLLDFVGYFEDHYPDILTGWNIKTFDIPYVVNRLLLLFGEETTKRLSPWNLIREKKIANKFGGEAQTYQLYGISTLDYMELFDKFGYTYGPQESRTLDHISSVILGDRKVSYDEHESLEDLYNNDYQTYIRYNIKDVSLVNQMEEVTGFIRLALTLAYMGGVNYEDALASVGIWESIIYRHLMRQNIVFPPRSTRDFTGKYEGAFVKDPLVGKHNWIASFDLNSLYPLTIVSMNIGPETMLPGIGRYTTDIDKWLDGRVDHAALSDKNASNAINGVRFRIDEQSFLSNIIEDLYQNRSSTKKEMLRVKQEAERVDKNTKEYRELHTKAENLDNIQHAVKIALNSLYGVLGNRFFWFTDVKMSEAITRTGQLVVKWGEKTINDYLQNIMQDDKDRIIAMDTDSVVGGTIINVNNEDLTIEEFYNRVSDISTDEKTVVPIKDKMITPSVSLDGSLEMNQINYVMRHKVNKPLYRITNKHGQSVEVTEDHSIIVKTTDGKIMEVKPSELNSEKHSIITLHRKSNDSL